MKKINETEAAKKTKGFFDDFKAFAFKGNVVDMAVGVIIGGAFGAIVSSLINDIIMPAIGVLIRVDFSQWYVALDGNTYASLEEAQAAGVGILHYGNLISAVVYFLLVALSIFVVVRALHQGREKYDKKHAPAPAPEKKPRLCPYCFSEIHDEATRCPHCTSELPK